MSDEVLDDVMLKGNCKGKADAIVNCQCSIETAPKRCEQAEHCMFYSYYKCSKQSQPLGYLSLKGQRKKTVALARGPAQRSFCFLEKKEYVDEENSGTQ